jgi:hypothetical protein
VLRVVDQKDHLGTTVDFARSKKSGLNVSYYQAAPCSRTKN